MYRSAIAGPVLKPLYLSITLILFGELKPENLASRIRLLNGSRQVGWQALQ
jgi:hypothetical protein